MLTALTTDWLRTRHYLLMSLPCILHRPGRQYRSVVAKRDRSPKFPKRSISLPKQDQSLDEKVPPTRNKYFDFFSSQWKGSDLLLSLSTHENGPFCLPLVRKSVAAHRVFSHHNQCAMLTSEAQILWTKWEMPETRWICCRREHLSICKQRR